MPCHAKQRTTSYTQEETDKDWARAQKYVERGDLERAKRTICHTLRMNMLALQLAQRGAIEDFGALFERWFCHRHAVTLSLGRTDSVAKSARYKRGQRCRCGPQTLNRPCIGIADGMSCAWV